MPENDDHVDGPKYKLSSFLFGNVDKQGQIEEYKNDEELKSINNIDQCHVKEVEETTQCVLESEAVVTTDCESTSSSQYSNVSLVPVDYYDEQETVPEDIDIDLKQIVPQDDVIVRAKAEEDEDYDDVPEGEADTSGATQTALPEPIAVNPPETPSTVVIPDSSPLSSQASTDLSNSDLNVILSSSIDETQSQVASTDGDDAVKAEVILPSGSPGLQDSTLSTEPVGKLTEGAGASGMMPPPLHPAPLSLSRQHQSKTTSSSRGPDSPSGVAGSPIIGSPASPRVDSPVIDRMTINSPSPSHDPCGLQTPMGSLMPLEYANVEITQLFPTYDPERTPRWIRLFRLPHAPSTYREFIERAPQLNSLLAERNARHADRLHLVYDEFLDLGQIPQIDEIVERDEVDELNTPLPPGSDCLAGHEKSWWRRAFAAALAEATNTTQPSQTASTDPMTNRTTNKNTGKAGNNAANTGKDGTGRETTDSENAKDAAEDDKAISHEDLCRGWRLGPAKYWYDQLGIPLDADISTWTEWRRQNLTTAVTGSVDGGVPVTQDLGHAALKVEDLAARQSEKLEDHGDKAENCVAGTKDDEESTGIASSEVPSRTNESVVNVDAESPANAMNQKPLAERNRVTVELPQNVFYPYQLINWEEDIIYDPQLSANKITASSKMNAAYAGWIPSQHCRTMAAFQDTYQGKFPYIVSSKALNGLNAANAVMEHLLNDSKNASVPSAPPYAIFPVENEGILSDSWIHDIIYDSELPAHQLPPPFLLTLDSNDETCLMDSVDDAAIAAAISAARGQRQRQLTARGADATQDASNPLSTTTGPRGSDARGDLLGDNAWSAYGSGSDLMGTSGSKSSAPINRASLQVSFGLASTRGMLTGALAKAEHGAEKVKMILGKHGLLAEDDWQPDQDKFATSDVTNNGALGESTSGDMAGSEGNALASAAAAVSGIPPKDPLNLSNDEYYAIRSGALGVCGGLARCGPLQHSTPAVELWPPFFPTYMSSLRLRQFHRVPLKRYLRGPMAQYNVPFSVTNLIRHIQKKAREREEEKAATGGGDIFFMRNPADLSGTDGDVILCEFSEEFPPLMTQVGMATRVINYYRPLTPRDRSLSPAPNASGEPPDLPFGSLVYVSGTDSPFLGVIRPGGCLQTLENNMYRAPIYPHSMPHTDFLLIRNRNGISIRRINNVFTVGQEIPLTEVPGPNSKRANNFVRDFLQVFILRLFLRSTDEPKRIKIEEIRKAFPNHSESSVRKRLKVCADFRRTGSDASWWVLRSDYRLPSEEEVRYLVSPEDCCAHYSMLAAELRLKDAGYGEKSIFVLDENQEDEEEKEGQPKMEDEVRAAPWNTTRAYLASQRGGCFLELHGAADPTGCGEAFSYSKTSAKPGALFRQAGGEVARGLLKGKRTVTGTDADLRKLHLRDARALLRSFGISEADLKSFKRWEIIDMVRFTSTERAKQGEEEGSAKFARGSRLSMGEQVRCYREECQRIFDLQNRVLSNPELLSSDEEVSSEEDDEEVSGTGGGDATGGRANVSGTAGGVVGQNASSIGGVRLSSLSSTARSFTNMSRNIEAVISNRMSVTEFEQRREEADRDKLKRALESGEPILGGKRPRKTNPAGSIPSGKGTTTTTTATENTDSNPATTTTAATTTTTVYEASAQAAGTILDLPPPWPNATRKLLRIIRTYSEDGQQYTRTELVPWSPVVEIYLKIRQTRNDEFIHNFVDSDNQFREQQRKEKRRLQDQLRRLRKQQAQIRERGGVVGSGSGVGASGLSGTHRPSNTGGGLSSTDPAHRRRRHKPLTSALVKMRCGACGQTGHMRTNKECPMYGKGGSVATTDLPPAAARRALDRGRLRGAQGARGAAAALLLAGEKCDADAIAAAQALASKPVCELLAEQEEQREADKAAAASGVDHDGSSQDRSHAGREGDESRDSSTPFGEVDMTVEGTKLKLHSNLTRYIQEQNRRNLKLKIHRQLLDRLNVASAMVQSASAKRRALASRAGTSGAGGAGGRGRRASLVDDEFPSGIKHRGNRRRIDPRVALNHIFEGIYKGLTQIPGYKIFMHPVKEKDWPNYYSQISEPMDLSQIRMKINENAYATREEFLSDIRLIYNNSLSFNGRYSSYTETAMKMCSHVMEEFCHKELKLMRLESLVNPLLDEDDLVGFSFLLQQAIEAMRSVEHSRPFYTPVDKRRYPDYYKVISHPMDLSTLEKLVKENRFRSRAEFLTQLDLILSNCITFNGPESPLTEIARKMLEAARARLEQDAEMLETIEANIRSKQTEMGAGTESSLPQSQSMLELESLDSGAVNSKATTQSPWPSTSSSTALTSTGIGGSRKPAAKRGPDSPDQSGASRPRKLAKTSTGDMELPSGDTNSQQSFDVDTPVEPSARSLRQRTTDTWYGVDLEYDDDDDDEDEDEGVDDTRGDDDDDVDDENDDGENEDTTVAKDRSEDEDDLEHDEESRSHPPWVTDEESMGDSIVRFARTRDNEDNHTWSSPQPQLDDTRTQMNDSDHSPYTHSPSSLPADVHRSRDNISVPPTRAVPHRVSDNDGDDEEDEDTRVGPHSYSEEEDLSDADLPDWEDGRQPIGEDSHEGYPNRRQVTYIDEDTRFSMGGTTGQQEEQQQPNPLTDDLVAQDLQLTDSENGSSLSGQGGELFADSELAFVAQSHDAVPHSTAAACERSDYGSSMRFADPSIENRPTTTKLEGQPDPHVAFFISEGEDDSDPS